MNKDINFGEDAQISRMQKKMQKIYNQIMGTLQQHLVEALKTNDVESIQQLIEVMEEAGREWIESNDGKTDEAIVSAAQKALNNVLRQTKLIEELFNDDKTTVEEYEAFYNKLIASFIDEEVVPEPAHKRSRKAILPEQAFTNNRKVLYKRVYTSDGTDGNKIDAIPNLHVLMWDFDEKAVMPITFSLHEALSEGIADPFIESCMTEEGKKFIGDTIMEFVKSNTDAAQTGMEHVGQDMGGLHIRPSVVCPKPDLCFDLLNQAKQESDIDIKEAFADINPDDFAE